MWSADNTMQGAGGFMDQTYDGQSNQDSNKSDQVRGSALVPVMIGHIIDDSIDTFNLWGTPIKLVTLVAFIRKSERTTTKVSYELVDETGSIMAYQWVEEERAAKLATVPAETYARVVGSPREQGDSRHIFLLKIKPVEQLAEVFEHLLEVTFVCFKAEEMSNDRPNGERASISDSAAQDSEGCHGMNKDQAAVFKMIQSHNDCEGGIERSDLRAKLPGNLRDKLDDVLEFLVCEGHIYTTCTDDHFRTT